MVSLTEDETDPSNDAFLDGGSSLETRTQPDLPFDDLTCDLDTPALQNPPFPPYPLVTPPYSQFVAPGDTYSLDNLPFLGPGNDGQTSTIYPGESPMTPVFGLSDPYIDQTAGFSGSQIDATAQAEQHTASYPPVTLDYADLNTPSFSVDPNFGLPDNLDYGAFDGEDTNCEGSGNSSPNSTPSTVTEASTKRTTESNPGTTFIPRKCGKCAQDDVYDTYKDLKFHRRNRCSSNVVTCHTCGHRVSTKHDLRRHRRAKHRDGKIVWIRCPALGCTYKSDRGDNVKRHREAKKH
ncbi:uncharacterized protein C8A04DRAFT_33062 [Dichotomopilus funicola]|uniref:C2H2-type domain-containing protein n=1 Tax=Dichotomopilus funicola TaxID=1934379 RepID=A0AAN6ZIU9_9PEZI|nr:hypothetical protein C8A04DRAFT_33062 [Dichotomopilus funicola]